MDVVARLFVTVWAATIAETAEALEPWLARVEPPGSAWARAALPYCVVPEWSPRSAGLSVSGNVGVSMAAWLYEWLYTDRSNGRSGAG